MKNLESTRIFVKIVQLHSFSKASDVLKLPTSTVSRGLRQLEQELGTKLILRTTRSLNLTAAGKAYFEKTVGPITELENANRAARGSDDFLSGPIKITANEDQGALVVTPVIGKILQKYPLISFEVRYTSEVLDLVKEGFDLALRVGRLNNSRFKSRPIGEIKLIAVASKQYLSARTKLNDPRDLDRHECLVYGPGSEKTRFKFESKNGRRAVAIKPHSVANHMPSLAVLAAHGVGVAFVPAFICRKELMNGTLVRVLPEWTITTFELHILTSSDSAMPPRVKLVADEIVISARELLTTQ